MAAKIASVFVLADDTLTSPFEQTVTTTDLGGSTPTAVRVDMGYSTDNTGSLNAVESGWIGFSDGTTEAGVGWRAEDVGSGNTNTDACGSTDYLGGTVHPTADNVAQSFSLKNFISNGCVVTWNAQPLRAVYIKFTFYVAARAEVIIHDLLTTGTIGTSAETVSFNNSSLHPAYATLIGLQGSITTGDNFTTTARVGTGHVVSDQAVTPTIKQFAYGFAREDAAISPFQGSVSFNSEESGGTARCFAYATVPIANGNGVNELECTDTAAGSMELTRQNAIENTGYDVLILALDFDGEIGTDLGHEIISGGSLTSHTVSGLSWEPQFYHWQGSNVSSAGYLRGNLSGSINILGCPAGVIGFKSDNRQSNATNTYSLSDTGIVQLHGDDDILDQSIDHNAYTSDGWTLTINTWPASLPDTSNKYHSWVAFEKETSTVEFDPDILTDTSTLTEATGTREVLYDPDTLTETNTLTEATGTREVLYNPDTLTDTNTLTEAAGTHADLVTFDPDILTDTSTLTEAVGTREVLYNPDTLTDTNTLTEATASVGGTVEFNPDTLTDTNTLSESVGSRAVLYNPDVLTDTNTLTESTGSRAVLFTPDALTDSNTLTEALGSLTDYVFFDPDALTDTSTLSEASGTREVLLDPDTLSDTDTLTEATGTLSGSVSFEPDLLTDSNSLSEVTGTREALFDPDSLTDTNILSEALATAETTIEFDPDTLTDTNTLSESSHVRGIRISASMTGSGQLAASLDASISLQVSFNGTGNLDATMSRSRGLVAYFHASGSLSADLSGTALAPVSQVERVQQSLLSAATTGPYYVTQYDADTNLVSVTDTQASPASIVAEEISARFGVPVRYRLSHRLEKQEWPWEIVIDFHQPVALEFFEEVLAANPITLKRDKANGLQQVTLELESVDYEHPLHYQPERGTRARVKVLARLGPV